ncbi:E3 ubiquitin-protein ligase AMFR [Folsomia candida]|uniref:E3 ubiquitin-protein ligase AMFR n=1 Tax=Folsomia candida TaxID=158441 RepID=UPI000B8FDF58|nr:E3 ubiquitin-protein ligase AMFR [Folsomia candida]
MEHLYQPEEGIFSANYETFKEYYTNPHLTPAHHPPKGTKLLDHLIPDDANNLIHPTMSNASLPQAPGNSALDAYFHMSWNVVHMASQQPHCVWPLLNMSYCLLILLGHSVQRRVFGVLRASEQDNMKEQFWNLVFYKVVFVFGVVNVQDVEDAVGWCFFVFLIGCLQLARQLCQERHNYLILMNDWSRRGQCRRHRILGLLCFIFVSSILLFVGVGGWYFCYASGAGSKETDSLDIKPVYYGHGFATTTSSSSSGASARSSQESSSASASPGAPLDFNLGLHSVIFMLCELGLLVIQTLHVLIICIFEQVRTKWYKGKQISDETYSNISHSINFKFDLISLLFDLVHHVHMLVCCNLFLSMTSLVVSLQMRNRVRKIHRVLKKRQCYLWLTEHIDSYPDAVFGDASGSSSSPSSEEEKCAICWDTLSSQKAKSLPCHHIFHTPCLRQWLIVSMNCPACRHSLVNEKEQFRPAERTTRRLYAPRPIGLWGFLQTGQALLDLFGGWDPQYDDYYDNQDSPATPVVPLLPHYEEPHESPPPSEDAPQTTITSE